LLIGYFERLDAERAIAWRAADSFALRDFLGLVLPEAPPDHSTISRTRRVIDLETHEAVFTWMLQRLADAGLVKGKTVGIDATTLEANAALRSIVRRDTGEPAGARWRSQPHECPGCRGQAASRRSAVRGLRGRYRHGRQPEVGHAGIWRVCPIPVAGWPLLRHRQLRCRKGRF
jgi:Transposase domain (DUF772)